MSEAEIRSKLSEIDKEIRRYGATADLLNEAGVGYFLLGEYENAVSHFLAAQEIEETPQIIFNLANAYSRLEQPDMAISMFLKVLELDPAHAGSLNNLADEYERKGDTDKAHELFHYLTHLYPDEAVSHFNLGNFFLRQNQHIEASGCYEKAIQKDPEFADAFYNIGWILYRVKAFTESMEYINKGLAVEPGHADLIELKEKVSGAQGETAG